MCALFRVSCVLEHRDQNERLIRTHLILYFGDFVSTSSWLYPNFQTKKRKELVLLVLVIGDLNVRVISSFLCFRI